MKKTIIYKITDADFKEEKPLYFTFTGLRIYILYTLWDNYDQIQEHSNMYSKKEIAEIDEYLFAYLDSWNYQVTRILLTDQTSIIF